MAVPVDYGAVSALHESEETACTAVSERMAARLDSVAGKLTPKPCSKSLYSIEPCANDGSDANRIDATDTKKPRLRISLPLRSAEDHPTDFTRNFRAREPNGACRRRKPATYIGQRASFERNDYTQPYLENIPLCRFGAERQLMNVFMNRDGEWWYIAHGATTIVDPAT
jgi:hypothetical protein